MKLINKFKSFNFNKRKNNISPNLIIIHYTAMQDEFEAIEHLLDSSNKVSCHFLINKKGSIYNLVDLDKRAWHAGLSYWKNYTDINSRSIGIELDNSGPLNRNENFTLIQTKSLIKLITYLKKKYLISNHDILGHSDISPYRKIDPGIKFPWLVLSMKSLVFFPKKITKKQNENIENYFLGLGIRGKKKQIIHMLDKIGYDVSSAIKSRNKFLLLIRAYKFHFNQSHMDGKLDAKTFKLIKSHFNEILTKRI